MIDDDGLALAKKVKQADVFLIVGHIPYSTLDARTKAFIERLYPLRHGHGYMVEQSGGAVVIYCIPTDKEIFPLAGFASTGIDSTIKERAHEGVY